eukprot:1156222-Pelagomonas_calceolata.AAC.6
MSFWTAASQYKGFSFKGRVSCRFSHAGAVCSLYTQCLFYSSQVAGLKLAVYPCGNMRDTQK